MCVGYTYYQYGRCANILRKNEYFYFVRKWNRCRSSNFYKYYYIQSYHSNSSMKTQTQFRLKMTIGTLFVNAMLLAGCGGGGTSSPVQTTPAAQAAVDAIPTLSAPVRDAATMAVLKSEARQLEEVPLTEIKPHRTAESSFGPLSKSAPRLAHHTVSVDGSRSGWLSTGMYAAAGEIVDVTVPSDWVGKGYMIHISGHMDDIGGNRLWYRMPSGIQRSFEINKATTKVASPYGGAIYIDLLEGADGTKPRTGGMREVIVHNAVEAPYFVLGKTTNADWIAKIRQNPAPYAELVSERLAISVPSSMIRTLDDPQALMRYWDEVVALQDWVGGTEHHRTGPDRINFDVQISGGYLHAGYPIQGPASVESSVNLLNLAYLRKDGEWGYFHELGHEMQNQPHLWSGGYDGSPFTFSGGVEVSVNIFAKAAMDRFAPLANPEQGSGWGWSVYPGQVLTRARAAISDARKPGFSQKDQYPFFFSLADGLGWPMYRQVLSSYVADAVNQASAFPTTDQQKRDQWLIRWSRFSGYNMVEYMVRRWKLPVSEQAIQTVNAMNLPTWLPASTRIDGFTLPANGNKQLDLKNTGIGLDGPVPLVRASAGDNLTLTANQDGSHTVAAKPGFAGRDKLTIVYRSEAGNEVATVINIEVVPGG